MVRSLLCCLSLWLALGSCQGQSAPVSRPAAPEPCADRRYQDSLVTRYLENGAQRYGYNHPNWEKYCDSLIAACPNMALAYREKAIPYLKNGDYARAFALEDRAVALDPKRWLAYRAFLKCIFTKDYRGALVDFERAEQLTPGGYEMDHTYWFYRGLCHLELGELPQAAADLQRDVAAQQRGDLRRDVHFNTLFYQGVVAYEQKNYPEARRLLEACLQIYAAFPDAHYYLALTLRPLSQAAAARQHLQLAQRYLQQGYGLNEDNVFYANYPHQITRYEVDQELARR
ncbi:tetratricopeptide repeat protein [Hymenobacter sp. B81]|uniref:tetratricopeptide repeat protein n=1 Tax=Hymenobacter sp. B81 TaxID=3344878 RepID=UPI0037DC5B64